MPIELTFSGDKSLSHRAALFAAIAQGRSIIRGFLPAQDTMNTLMAMKAVGVKVTRLNEDNTEYEVVSSGIQGFHSPGSVIDAGNSGTGARLMLGLFCGLKGFEAIIDGDQSLRKRPMQRITAPLSSFGAEFEPDDKLPVRVIGKRLLPVVYKEELGSAQVKSALVLAAMASGVDLRIEEPRPSRDHTENMLRFLGVNLTREPDPSGGFVIEAEPPYELHGTQMQIWGDLSSAAFFIVAALLLAEDKVVIKNVLLNEYRDGFLKVLKRMGAAIEIIAKEEQVGEKGADIVVEPSVLKGTTIEAAEIPSLIDELPILTIAGLFCDGEFEFRGAHELRVKESDRIHAMVKNLQSCKIDVEEYDDGLKLQGDPQAKLRGGDVNSFHDHRIVMSFEIAALRSLKNGGTTPVIEGKEWVNTSFPGFYEKLNHFK